MPNAKIFKDDILVSTPDKNYTLNNVESFFNDINNPNGWKMYLNEKDFTNNLTPPGVEVHCLYGQGMTTIKRLVYKNNTFPDQPSFIYEDGDGTVNLRSLEACQDWSSKQKQKVHLQGFQGADHMAVLSDVRVVNYIINTIKAWTNPTYGL